MLKLQRVLQLYVSSERRAMVVWWYSLMLSSQPLKLLLYIMILQELKKLFVFVFAQNATS